MAQNKDQSGGKMSREEAGRKGGEAVSQDREHMSDIGRKGGQQSQSNQRGGQQWQSGQRGGQQGGQGGSSGGGSSNKR